MVVLVWRAASGTVSFSVALPLCPYTPMYYVVLPWSEYNIMPMYYSHDSYILTCALYSFSGIQCNQYTVLSLLSGEKCYLHTVAASSISKCTVPVAYLYLVYSIYTENFCIYLIDHISPSDLCHSFLLYCCTMRLWLDICSITFILIHYLAILRLCCVLLLHADIIYF